MTIVANIFPEDLERRRAMGTILGGIAAGVLSERIKIPS